MTEFQRLDIRIPQEIYDRLKAIARETNQPLAPRTKEPSLAPVVVNLIKIGLEAVESNEVSLEPQGGVNPVDLVALEKKLLASLTDKLEQRAQEYQAKLGAMVKEAVEAHLEQRAQAQAAREAEYQAKVERQIAEMALEEKRAKANRGAAKSWDIPPELKAELEGIKKDFSGTQRVISLLHNQGLPANQITSYLKENEFPTKKGSFNWRSNQVKAILDDLTNRDTTPLLEY